eukprot:CAMPEP_0176044666 /NCGR_PEP_ID=MMETSP0120_2-20121206/22169_1 /TAXON_ID=160619 /ORGANISM="Kryptoperidinium foliaceum, Strain CCMP 1326" /LENGTH=319 /DNA_ID=CAMNT_0017378071 /DNA_START=184 /DNA_END=1144 /DNA_ORIENTATION=+
MAKTLLRPLVGGQQLSSQNNLLSCMQHAQCRWTDRDDAACWVDAVSLAPLLYEWEGRNNGCDVAAMCCPRRLQGPVGLQAGGAAAFGPALPREVAGVLALPPLLRLAHPNSQGPSRPRARSKVVVALHGRMPRRHFDVGCAHLRPLCQLNAQDTTVEACLVQHRLDTSIIAEAYRNVLDLNRERPCLARAAHRRWCAQSWCRAVSRARRPRPRSVRGPPVRDCPPLRGRACPQRRPCGAKRARRRARSAPCCASCEGVIRGGQLLVLAMTRVNRVLLVRGEKVPPKLVTSSSDMSAQDNFGLPVVALHVEMLRGFICAR